MSIDRGLVRTAPQTGYFARVDVEKEAQSPSGISGCVAPRQRPLGAATISEISFGICSRQTTIPAIFDSNANPISVIKACYVDLFFFPHRRGAASAKLMIGFIQSKIPCPSSKQPLGFRSGSVPSVPHQRDLQGLQAFQRLVLCGTEDQ